MSRILYITFIDFGKADSGSAVRPQSMYRAFTALGADVLLLSGSQARENKAQRIQNIKAIEAEIDKNRPDICYIEPPTYPILYKADYDFIRHVHEQKIPIGYFLRDAYQKLGREFYYGEKRTLRSAARDVYLNALYRKNERLMQKNVDIVYFPSKTMASYFSYKDMRALPPACVRGLCRPADPESRAGIYVGGLSKAYGTDIMLGAYELLNAGGGSRYPLTIVCRKAEQQNIPEKYRGSSWLKVVNASGDQLAQHYGRSAYALLPRMDCAYNDFAVSVKVYEYMSYGLPVVACNCREMAAIVNGCGFGKVTGFTPESFAEGVKALADDAGLRAKYRENALNAVVNGNLWTDRAKKVMDDLGGLKRR